MSERDELMVKAAKLVGLPLMGFTVEKMADFALQQTAHLQAENDEMRAALGQVMNVTEGRRSTAALRAYAIAEAALSQTPEGGELR